MAGSNEIEGQVSLLQCSANQLILQFHLKGESGSHPLGGESGSSDAVNAFARSVVDEIKK